MVTTKRTDDFIDDDIRDEVNPRYALQTMATALLGAAARGELDLNVLAKLELAARGLDHDGKWCGFDASRALISDDEKAVAEEQIAAYKTKWLNGKS